jgi:zinc transport system substrate-binding protein
MAPLVAACGRRPASTSPAGNQPLRVVVSIAPLKGLADDLTKDLGAAAKVELLVPVGAMEHGYEIPPSMISKLVQADVVVYVGLGLEPQVEKILKENPRKGRREVCFADVVGIHPGAGAPPPGDHSDAAHHDEEEDELADHHAGADPHLWLDPVLVAKLIPAMGSAIAGAARDCGMTDAAARIDAPTDGAVARVSARVAEVDSSYSRRLQPFQGRTIITAHAAWGRLAARYGLEQAPLAGLEANEPSPGAIARAAQLIREKKAGALFAETQVNPATVRRLADMTGAKVFELDPLGDGDWFKMMDKNLDALTEGLSVK